MCTGLVDHNWAAVYGSTVDHGRRRPRGSPERGLRATPVSGSLPAVGENEEETSGVPTMGEGGRCGAGGEADDGEVMAAAICSQRQEARGRER
jgi:hypothetical protein